MKGFIPHYSDGSIRPQALEYKIIAASQTPKKGLALKWSSGKLVLCDGANAPDYICMCERNTLAADTQLPVLKINPDMVFETENSTAINGVSDGTPVQIASDGLRVTATTTSSPHAKIVGREGTDTAAGATVYVRFV